MPQDYQLLVPEAKVAVPTDWLATILARLRRKEPKLMVTKMLDGFLTPWIWAGLEAPQPLTQNGSR